MHIPKHFEEVRVDILRDLLRGPSLATANPVRERD